MRPLIAKQFLFLPGMPSIEICQKNYLRHLEVCRKFPIPFSREHIFNRRCPETQRVS